MIKRVVAQDIFVVDGCRHNVASRIKDRREACDGQLAIVAGDRNRANEYAVSYNCNAANCQIVETILAVEREAAALSQRRGIWR